MTAILALWAIVGTSFAEDFDDLFESSEKEKECPEGTELNEEDECVKEEAEAESPKAEDVFEEAETETTGPEPKDAFEEGETNEEPAFAEKKEAVEPREAETDFGRATIDVGVGSIVNNPMVQRHNISMSGSLASNQGAFMGQVVYSPDRAGDLKGLPVTLLEIASSRSGSSDYEHPIDKTILSASVLYKYHFFTGVHGVARPKAVRAYVCGGAGLMSSKRYSISSDYDGAIAMRFEGNNVTVPLTFGGGYDVLTPNKFTIGLSVISWVYRGATPVYGSDDDQVNPYQIYNDINIVANVGKVLF